MTTDPATILARYTAGVEAARDAYRRDQLAAEGICGRCCMRKVNPPRRVCGHCRQQVKG